MRLPLLSSIVLLTSAMPTLMAAQTEPRGDQRVMALRHATLKPDVRAADFERYFGDSIAGPLNRYIPGMRAYLLKGERGARVGEYVIVFEFVGLGRRNEYFPKPDSASARWEQLARALPQNATENLARYVEIDDYTDYVVAR